MTTIIKDKRREGYKILLEDLQLLDELNKNDKNEIKTTVTGE